MGILARGIKLPNVAAVQCAQHANARHHGGPVELDDQQQGFYRGLPLLEILVGLGKLLDIVRGVLEGDELATAGHGNRFVEGARPVSHDAAARTGRLSALCWARRRQCGLRQYIRGIRCSLKIGEVNLLGSGE